MFLPLLLLLDVSVHALFSNVSSFSLESDWHSAYSNSQQCSRFMSFPFSMFVVSASSWICRWWWWWWRIHHSVFSFVLSATASRILFSLLSVYHPYCFIRFTFTFSWPAIKKSKKRTKRNPHRLSPSSPFRKTFFIAQQCLSEKLPTTVLTVNWQQLVINLSWLIFLPHGLNERSSPHSFHFTCST